MSHHGMVEANITTEHTIHGSPLRTILALQFLQMLLVGFVQLVAPLYALALGASQVMLGIVVGAFGMAGILLSILSSVLSDHLGRRTMMQLSFILWMASGTVGLLAPPLLWLVAAQLLVGLADIAFGISGVTYLTEVTPPGQHARFQSLGTGFTAIGLVVGPVLGGQICRLAGFRTAFGLVILLGVMGVILSNRLAVIRGRTAERVTFSSRLIQSHRTAFALMRSNQRARMGVLLTLLGTMSWMTVGSSFYVAYLHHLAFSPDRIGLMATLRASAAVVSRFSFAMLASRLGVTGATLAGFAVGGLALAVTPFLTAVPLLAVAGCIGEAADRLRVPGIYTIIADSTDQDSRALAVALVAVAWATASTVTPPALGLIAEHVSLSATFWVAGSLAVISTALLWAWNRALVAGERALDARSPGAG